MQNRGRFPGRLAGGRSPVRRAVVVHRLSTIDARLWGKIFCAAAHAPNCLWFGLFQPPGGARRT